MWVQESLRALPAAVGSHRAAPCGTPMWSRGIHTDTQTHTTCKTAAVDFCAGVAASGFQVCAFGMPTASDFAGTTGDATMHTGEGLGIRD